MAKLNRVMDQRLSGDEASLEVDLDEMFGTIVPDSSSFRQAVGQKIIDRIRERTQEEQEDVRNSGFKDYSREYADSIEFKAYGKSKNKPNLTQTGDMLGLMDIIGESKNKITIGWTDDLQAKKAHGHITGSVGVKRNFLGLPIEDIESIADDMRDELPLGDETPTNISQLTERFLNSATTAQEASTFGEILRSFRTSDEE